MKPLNGLRTWWQKQTGEEETPFDGDAPVWLVSMVVHLVLMLILSFVFIPDPRKTDVVNVESYEEEIEEPELTLPEEFAASDFSSDQVGADSLAGADMALSQGEIISMTSVVPEPLDVEEEISEIEINQAFDIPAGQVFSNVPVKGSVGVGTTGAAGAIDQITKEILNSLEERKTLVVWLFDQSGSLDRQREQIVERFEKIYDELGVIEAAGDESFAKHDSKPLLTSVVAFGQRQTLLTPKPTDNLAEIKEAVASIEQDTSGVERVFSAVDATVKAFSSYRMVNADNPEPKRNVLLVVFTDEKGDDAEIPSVNAPQPLDITIKNAKRYQMPVYVVGVPAPFGRQETLVKWVDPDPEYDQTPQWGEVTQGPESFRPERIKLHFSGTREDSDPIDSGFGPYALTRLCYETGGIYFAVHPNRNVNRAVSRRETTAFSAHIKHFFDPNVMRKYRPDYVSLNEYNKRISENKARSALVQAATLSFLTPMESPRLRFARTDEAAFVNALSEAQKESARLGPKVQGIYEKLKVGEDDREDETVLRWQAGYDLAMGRAMAVGVRTKTYNSMLAAAKRGLKFKDEKSNTWVLKPADEITTGSQDAKLAKRAKEYLQRVIDDHPGTPWALLAKRELETPIGWTWTEEYTAPPRRGPPGAGNGNAPAPPNDERMMLKKPPKKRRPPKL